MPEIAIVVFGVALRCTVVNRFDPRWGYDAESHVRNIEWYRDTFSIPPLDANRMAYHPPLFYLIEGWILHAIGLSDRPLIASFEIPDTDPALRALQLGPLVFAALRLLVVAVFLARVLPERRSIRVLSLITLAVLPSSIHLDAMVSNESLNALMGAVVLALMSVVTTKGTPRWTRFLPLGVALGLGLLSKASSVALVAVAVVVAVLDLVWKRSDWPRPPLARFWAVSFMAVVAVSGWYYARNLHVYGTPTPTPFDRTGWDRDMYLATGAHEKPYLQRRSLSYFLGWSQEVFDFPFFPSGSGAEARFLPVLVASTFTDYYNYGLARDRDAGRLSDDAQVNGWPVRPATMAAARIAIWCGLVIALTTAVSGVLLLIGAVRRKGLAEVAVFIVPLFVLIVQMHYTISFPVDREGVVKGAYMQLAAPSLALMFSMGVAWLWSRPPMRWLAVVNVGALMGVGGYQIVCVLVSYGVRSVVFWRP
jgi:4-amino-4-deoxy-L-arabinose transferase-like glycosyltransferase